MSSLARHMRLLRVVVSMTLGALGSTACAVGLKQVSAEQLATLSEEQRTGLGPLNDEHAKQVAALDARRVEEKQAEREVSIARQELKCAEAQLAIAKLRYEGAMETKNADTMLPARAMLADAEHALAVAQGELSWRVESERYAEAAIDEAESVLDVIVAKRELARFDAVAETQKLADTVKAEERSGYLGQMAAAEQGHADARRAMLAAEAVMKQAQESLRRTQASAAAAGSEAQTPTPAK